MTDGRRTSLATLPSLSKISPETAMALNP